jgi:hypothetical protein
VRAENAWLQAIQLLHERLVEEHGAERLIDTVLHQFRVEYDDSDQSGTNGQLRDEFRVPKDGEFTWAFV